MTSFHKLWTMPLSWYENGCLWAPLLRTAGGLLQLFHHNKRLFQSTNHSGYLQLSSRDVTSRGSNSNSTRSSNLYYCSIKARSSIFLFEPKLELARTRKKSSKVQPKYRCQSITLAFSKKYLTLGKKNFHTWLKSFLSNGLLPDFFGFFAGKH